MQRARSPTDLDYYQETLKDAQAFLNEAERSLEEQLKRKTQAQQKMGDTKNAITSNQEIYFNNLLYLQKVLTSQMHLLKTIAGYFPDESRCVSLAFERIEVYNQLLLNVEKRIVTKEDPKQIAAYDKKPFSELESRSYGFYSNNFADYIREVILGDLIRTDPETLTSIEKDLVLEVVEPLREVLAYKEDVAGSLLVMQAKLEAIAITFEEDRQEFNSTCQKIVGCDASTEEINYTLLKATNGLRNVFWGNHPTLKSELTRNYLVPLSPDSDSKSFNDRIMEAIHNQVEMTINSWEKPAGFAFSERNVTPFEELTEWGRTLDYRTATDTIRESINGLTALDRGLEAAEAFKPPHLSSVVGSHPVTALFALT